MEQAGPLTAGILRSLLADLPDDTLVVLSKDAEGNGFSPLDGYGIDRYVAESTYSGYLVDVETEPDPLPDSVPCLVLWPTN